MEICLGGAALGSCITPQISRYRRPGGRDRLYRSEIASARVVINHIAVKCAEHDQMENWFREYDSGVRARMLHT